MKLPADYVERVYAGVLGKIIGVYLGRPIEGWSHRKILEELGEINYYVHEKRNAPLIVTDDDISGTFTFIRVLEDYGNNKDLTAGQIGQSWLNYIIENRTILWWGGMGMSTEHTAYLRLKQGIPAPRSGSAEMNGKVVAEQIGAQIFIDGWAMVSPGDAEQAAKFARLAASVSHDGEAIYGAQIVAAMEALAFVESDLNKILDRAVTLIPEDSVIYRMIADLRAFQAREKTDWKKCFIEVLEAHYGYDKFGGNCHMVPNHGVIILALLYCGDDFQRALMIANTCGWDTDCNSGNVGCFMGIKNGVGGIDAGPDWRGPVADRLYLPTAEGGGCITDAVEQSYRIANMGRALAGERPLLPKDGAKFHFSLPGSRQGFVEDPSAECRGIVQWRDSTAGGGLSFAFAKVANGRYARVATATFTPIEASKPGGYAMYAAPTIYPGQKVRALLSANSSGILPRAVLYLRHYTDKDELKLVRGPGVALQNDQQVPLEWTIPDMGGLPIAEIGVELSSEHESSGLFKLDYLRWDGEPEVTFRKAAGDWSRRAFVEGVSALQGWGGPGANDQFVLVQNEGRGLAIQGTRQWRNYAVSADVTPHLAAATGLAVRVQGMKRYYALLIGADGNARLVKALDGEKVLASSEMKLQLGKTYAMKLSVSGDRIRGSIDGQQLFDVTDKDRPLDCGSIGLVCEEGRVGFGPVKVGAV